MECLRTAIPMEILMDLRLEMQMGCLMDLPKVILTGFHLDCLMEMQKVCLHLDYHLDYLMVKHLEFLQTENRSVSQMVKQTEFLRLGCSKAILMDSQKANQREKPMGFHLEIHLEIRTGYQKDYQMVN